MEILRKALFLLCTDITLGICPGSGKNRTETEETSRIWKLPRYVAFPDGTMPFPGSTLAFSGGTITFSGSTMAFPASTIHFQMVHWHFQAIQWYFRLVFRISCSVQETEAPLWQESAKSVSPAFYIHHQRSNTDNFSNVFPL